MIRRVGVTVVIMGLLVGVASVGPWLVQQVTPRQLGTIQTWVDQIWWPATVIRCGVYALLAWGVYPLWVQGVIRQAQAVRDQQALDDDPNRHAAEARLRHLYRARQRSPWVFGAFLLSDGVIAQFPYWLMQN